MQVGEIVNEKEFTAYENCCRELQAIERKLSNGELPEGKRDKLIYRRKILEAKVLLQLAKRINF